MFDLTNMLEKISKNTINEIDFTKELLPDYHQASPKLSANKHAQTINAFALLPIGLVASASQDKTICIWDAQTLQCVSTLVGHTGAVTALTVLANGNLVSGSEDNTIRLWHGKTYQCIKILTGHNEFVSTLTVLPNGTLVSADGDSTIHLWDVEAGKIIKSLRGHTAPVYAMVALRDNTLISCSRDKTIRFWNTQNWKCIKDLHYFNASPNPTRALALFSDEMLVSGGNDDDIHLWNTITYEHKNKVRLHSDTVSSLAILSNNKLLSTANDGTIRCWERDKDELSCIATHQVAANAVIGLPNGNWMSGNKSGQICIWQVPTRQLKFSEIKPLLQQLSANRSVKAINLANIKLRDEGARLLLLLLSQRQDLKVSGVSMEGISDARLIDQLTQQLAKNNIERKAVVNEPKNPAPKPAPFVQAKPKAIVAEPKNPVVKPAPELKPIAPPREAPLPPPRVPAAAAAIQAEPKADNPASNELLVNNFGEIKISIRIPYNALKLEKQLGEGSFGVVYRGWWNNNTEVAIKKLKDQDINADVLNEFKNEASLMATLHSPHIVHLYGACFEAPNYALVVEYMPKGSLSSVLSNGQPLSWNIRYQIALNVGCGLDYLHSKNIIHGDLKSLNILLDAQFHAKISDFGMSKLKSGLNDQTLLGPSAGGTYYWMSPELLKGAKNSKESDVFSFGMVLWEIGARKFPYQDWKVADIREFVRRINNGERERPTQDTPPRMAELIKHCWFKEPKDRPKMDAAVTILRDEQQAKYPRP